MAILRPACTSIADSLRDTISLQRDPSLSIYAEKVHEIIDNIRVMFEEAGERTDTRTSVTEYQLFDTLPGKTRRRNLMRNDIITVVDPTPDQVSFVTGFSPEHPLQRSVIVCAGTDIFRFVDILQYKAVPITSPKTEDGNSSVVNRVFALDMPLNDEARAAAYQRGVAVFEGAIRYPQNPPLRTLNTYQSNGLLLPGSEDDA